MTLIHLDPDDLHFIVTYDPDRERTASRRDMGAVLEEIQALVNDGVMTAERRQSPQERRAGTPGVSDTDVSNSERPAGAEGVEQ